MIFYLLLYSDQKMRTFMALVVLLILWILWAKDIGVFEAGLALGAVAFGVGLAYYTEKPTGGFPSNDDNQKEMEKDEPLDEPLDMWTRYRMGRV